MVNKILKSILTVAAVVLCASLVIITGVLYSYFGNLQQEQLVDELRLAAAATETLGEQYLEGLEHAHYRLTWIDADGTVLFDNRVDAATMENHGDREEVQEALATGTGSSSRYSSTLTEKNLYEAIRLDNGSVLRISESRATIGVLVLGMLQPIALIMILTICVSVVLAKQMAKRVVEPLNQLNLDAPLNNDAYEEISPLLRRIHSQQLEIKRQMALLQRKQDEFDQITSNMKEALVLLDNVGRVVSSNPAANSLFDIPKHYQAEFLAVDRKQNMRKAMEQARETGEASFRETRNGRDYQMEVTAIQSEGQMIGMVVLGFDITEQVRGEQNRREFTANVSHELKTPLQSIVGSAELLENGIVNQEDVPRFVGHIRKEAARLVQLIEDIIGLSQLDEGTEMPREQVSLRSIAEEVREVLADTAKQKQISIAVTGDDGMVYGVRRLLYEILYNLCDNGVKYNHEQGSVTVDISETEDTVTVSVEDTGIGIPKEEQEKVFERFYRVDKSHSKQSGGTGLGLSIVKHGVQYHQGTIKVESELEKGTIIQVILKK